MNDIHFDIITCIYCGEPGRDRHHYKESVANSGRKRSYRKGETLPACRECNLLIGALTPTYTETCYLLYDKVSDRHKNILSIPKWDKEDLAELEGRLRRSVTSKIRKKKIIMERLDFLLKNAQSTLTYENIKDIIFYGFKRPKILVLFQFRYSFLLCPLSTNLCAQ